MTDVLFCAKYPFTQRAKEMMAEKKMRLEDVRAEAIERARKRVMGALKNGEIPRFIDMDDEAERELEAYAVARILLSLLKNRYFINRYAVAESKRASTYLRDDSEEHILQVAGDIRIRGEQKGSEAAQAEGDAGGRMKSTGAAYVIPVVDYLLYAPGSKDYKLINKPLSSGVVQLNKREFTRVVEEAVRLGIERSLPLPIAGAPDALVRAADGIRADAKGIEPTYEVKFEGGEFPRCIQSLIDRLKLGENLNHTARWALAVFMLSAGYSVDAVVGLYTYAPDFEERITKYQVEYAKKRAYKMPTCAWMRSQGIGCEPPCGLPTPLRYKGRGSGGKKMGEGDSTKTGGKMAAKSGEENATKTSEAAK